MWQHTDQKHSPKGLPTKRCGNNSMATKQLLVATILCGNNTVINDYNKYSLDRCNHQRCNFVVVWFVNKVATKIYWNHTFAFVFTCKFAAYFQNICVCIMLYINLVLIKKLLSHWNFYLLKSNKTLVYYNLVLAEELLILFMLQ